MTVIGLAALVQAGADTLVLTTSIVAARQWIAELRDQTPSTPTRSASTPGSASRSAR